MARKKIYLLFSLFTASQGFLNSSRTLRRESTLFNALETGFITIWGHMEEKFPISLLSGIPIGVLNDDFSISRVEDSTSSDMGWVQPRTYGELWIPKGSPVPTANIGIAILFKNGAPRYIMPSLDINVVKEGKIWRNRGVFSYPLAHSWQQFSYIPLAELSISAYIGTSNHDESSIETYAWFPIAEKLSVQSAVTKLVQVIADPPVEFDGGISILIAPLAPSISFTMPKDKSKLRVFLTDFPEPVRLLEVSDSNGGQLELSIKEVEDASRSDFLPEVYRSLYC